VKTVKLVSSELVALVDDRDALRVSWYSWCGYKSGRNVIPRARVSGRLVTLAAYVAKATKRHQRVLPVDGDWLNCQRDNLRTVTEREYHAARCVQRRELPRGVYARKTADGVAYLARISRRGRLINLGTYSTPEAASRVYVAAAAVFYGGKQP
jgi:hypothetical protein